MPRVLVHIYSEEELFLDKLFEYMASAPPPHYEQFAVSFNSRTKMAIRYQSCEEYVHRIQYHQ